MQLKLQLWQLTPRTWSAFIAAGLMMTVCVFTIALKTIASLGKVNWDWCSNSIWNNAIRRIARIRSLVVVIGVVLATSQFRCQIKQLLLVIINTDLWNSNELEPVCKTASFFCLLQSSLALTCLADQSHHARKIRLCLTIACVQILYVWHIDILVPIVHSEIIL